ncbi:MAG: phosphatase PAP2 family protein [Dehalococcoidales bacterium]|nr:phosphatase PAP2 family protein [Dehalococcoidales bacterium]
MISDIPFFMLINGLAGRARFADELVKGLAGDYFLPVACCLILVALWFGTREKIRRHHLQECIIGSLMSVGIANGFVNLCNNHYFRVRPFNELSGEQINLLFYMPTDSSFPSNFTAMLFALAVPVLFKSTKYGLILMAIALAGGFARIYVGIHYPYDILGGAAIGILTGILSYGLVKLIRPLLDIILGIMRKLFVA